MSAARLLKLNRHYQLAETSLKQKLFFMVSLSSQPFFGGNIFDEIIPHLFLGKLPTQDESKFIKEKIPNLGLVVSVVEDFEMNGKVLSFNFGIQSPSDWQEMGVRHHQLLAKDYTADMTIEDTIKTLKLMHETIEKGESVYIHCKAGRSRSATVVLLYCIFFGIKDFLEPQADIEDASDANIDEAVVDKIYQYIRSKRSQVDLHHYNFQKIQQVITADRKIKDYSERDLAVDLKQDSLQNKLDTYISSIECKESITQLNAFKQLKFYGIDKCISSVRRKHIQAFLDAIITADNSNWLFELFNNEGPLKYLLASRPHGGLLGTGKPNKRLEIVDSLKKELLAFFAAQLGCHKNDLLELIHRHCCNHMINEFKVL